MNESTPFRTPFDPGFKTKKTCSKGVIVGVVLAIAVLALILGLALGIGLKKKKTVSESFETLLTSANLQNHLRTFESYGSRAVLRNYNASIAYLKEKLKPVGCLIEEEFFVAPVFTDYGPNSIRITDIDSSLDLTLLDGYDFVVAQYGGSGVFDIPSTSLSSVNGSGCSPADFSDFPSGRIALIDVDDSVASCSALVKSTNALNAGAKAIIFKMDKARRRLPRWPIIDFPYFEGSTLIDSIPITVTTHAIGTMLKTLSNPLVSIKTNTSTVLARTSNLHCTMPDGDANNLIVAGAHLDSVPAGPGVNDNGSGSVSMLEIALRWAELKIKSKNKVQFSWWGAEELGLMGSFYFVKHTADSNPSKFSKIKMAFNFDMLGSPNGYPQVHSSKVPGVTIPPSARKGADAITAKFIEYFNQHNIKYKEIDLAANSDYYPFLAWGIPAGGLATGASELKTPQDQAIFGGLANVALDPCYHQYCDTVQGINIQLTRTLAIAAATVIESFANSNLAQVLGTSVVERSVQSVYGPAEFLQGQIQRATDIH